MRMRHCIVAVVLVMLISFGLTVSLNGVAPRENGQLNEVNSIGVVANYWTNCIQLIDPVTQTLSPPYMKGYLSSPTGNLLGVAISPDGTKAVIGSYGDNWVSIIDISGGFNVEPTFLCKVHIGINPQDIVFTPNGQYVLVTDGTVSDKIALVDVRSCSLKILYDTNRRDLSPADDEPFNSKHTFAADSLQYDRGCYTNAVAITPDGQIVLTCDTLGGTVNSFSLDYEIGTFSPIGRVVLDVDRPVNLEIAPDGRTVIVNCSSLPLIAVVLISADNPGMLWNMGNVEIPTRSSYSTAFSPDGSKAYILSCSVNQDTQVHVMDITGLGAVSYSGTSIATYPRRCVRNVAVDKLSASLISSSAYGINTLNVSPGGNYLYITNISFMGGVKEISILDLNTNMQKKTLMGVGVPMGAAFGY